MQFVRSRVLGLEAVRISFCTPDSHQAYLLTSTLYSAPFFLPAVEQRPSGRLVISPTALPSADIHGRRQVESFLMQATLFVDDSALRFDLPSFPLPVLTHHSRAMLLLPLTFLFSTFSDMKMKDARNCFLMSQ